MNIKHLKGKKAEDIATEFLIRNEFEIVGRNYHSRFGEIDIIATKDKMLHFVEVKFRKNNYHAGMSSISLKKQGKIIKTAEIFLYKHQEFSEFFTQFDAIIITDLSIPCINFLPDCFRPE